MPMKQYEFIEKLGKGTHGTVYLLKNNYTNKLCVCKSIPNKFQKHANREIKVLSKTEHRRIIKMHDMLHVSKVYYLILEYANYGTLESMLKYFQKNKIKASPTLIWSIAAQLLDSLKHLHFLGIIHRDIKPANILISKTEIKGKEHLEFKLCDFSLSVFKTSIGDRCIVGTPYYMAPEIISKSEYDNKVDVWALGVILYELCFNKKPFTSEDRDGLYEKILYEEPEGDFIYKNYKSLEMFVKSCLIKENRPTVKKLLKNEKIKLTLTTIELKYREIQIEQLEEKIVQLEQKNTKVYSE